MEAQTAAELNARMIEREKAGGRIRSPEVEAAFLATPRHAFLPGVALDTVYGGAVVVTRTDAEGRPSRA